MGLGEQFISQVPSDRPAHMEAGAKPCLAAGVTDEQQGRGMGSPRTTPMATREGGRKGCLQREKSELS